MLFRFQNLNLSLIFSNFRKQIAINLLFRQEFIDHSFGISDSSGNLNGLEGRLNHIKLIHFPLDFVPEHFVHKLMCGINLLPLFFLLTEISHGFGGNGIHHAFSHYHTTVQVAFLHYSLIH
jgi:hypothetical protein